MMGHSEFLHCSLTRRVTHSILPSSSKFSFSAEPIFEQLSAVTREVEEEVPFALPSDIRNYFQNGERLHASHSTQPVLT